MSQDLGAEPLNETKEKRKMRKDLGAEPHTVIPPLVIQSVAKNLTMDPELDPSAAPLCLDDP